MKGSAVRIRASALPRWRSSGQLERRGNLRQHVLYPVTGTGRVATVTRLLKLASVPDGVDAGVVMIQVPSLRRPVQA